jgi:hypothetical protein
VTMCVKFRASNDDGLSKQQKSHANGLWSNTSVDLMQLHFRCD